MNRSPPTQVQKNETGVIKFTSAYASLITLGFILGIGVGYLAWGRSPKAVAMVQATATPRQAAQAATQTGQPQHVKRYDVPVENDFVLGPTNAPITIIEFSDYECPYCRKWQNEVMGPLMDAFPGQIRFVYRDFPLTNMHPNAAPAAEAADCAGEQDKYYEYHDKLFSGEYQLGADTFEKYASEISLDKTKFDECLSNHRYQDEVQADLDYAANLGVQSTPTFFINGIAVVGAQPIEVFKEIVGKELAGQIP